MTVLVATALPVWGQTISRVPGLGTGAINGQVLDDGGKGISGAIVSVASDLPTPAPGQTPPPFTPFRALAVTAADGTFSVGNLPSGLIRVCAQVPNSLYVEVCRWPVAQTIITIGDGQSVKLPAIAMKKGFPLKIRVNDAAGLLSAAESPGKTVGVNPGVFSENHLFVPAYEVSRDAGGYTYQAVVPFDLPLHVSVSGTNLAVATTLAGAPAKSNFSTPITIPSGTTTLAPITVAISAVVAPAIPAK